MIVFRRFDRSGNELVVVCNFQPNYHEQYSFGVPFYADYEEIFTTEKPEYGGGAIFNGTVVSQNEPMHGEPYSLTVKIAPMSAMFFKAKNIRIPEDDLKKEGEKKKKNADKNLDTAKEPTAKKTSSVNSEKTKAPAKKAAKPIKKASKPKK